MGVRNLVAVVALLGLAGVVVALLGTGRERSDGDAAAATAASAPAPARAGADPAAAGDEPSAVAPVASASAATRVAPAAPADAERVAVESAATDGGPLARLIVVDRGGLPVPGARATIVTVDGDLRALAWHARDALVPADGLLALRLDGPPPSRLRAWATAPGHGLALAFLEGGGGAYEARIELDPGATVSGRAVDAHGAPLERVWLSFQSLEANVPTRHTPVLTLFDGTFQATARYTGQVRCWAQAAGVGLSEDRVVTVEPTGTTALGTLVLDGPGTIAGRVLFADGSPVPGVELAVRADGPTPGRGLRQGRDTTDGEGRFEVAGLAVGTYTVAPADGTDPIERRAGVPSGVDGLELTVDGWLLDVVARDADGAAVDMVEFSVGAADDADLGFLGLSQSFAPPRASARLFVARTSLVLDALDRDGRRYSRTLAADLPAGARRVELVTDDPTTARLRVRVGGAGLEEGSSVALTLQPREDGAFAWRDSEAGATEFVASGLLPGRYVVDVELDRARLHVAEGGPFDVELVAGGESVLNVDTAVGGLVEVALGVAGRADGSLADDPRPVRVLVRRSGGADWRMATVAHSRAGSTTVAREARLGRTYRLAAPLPAGTYDVAFEGPGLARAEREVTVGVGGTARLRVDLVEEP